MINQQISENHYMILGQISKLDKPDNLKANQSNMLPGQLVYRIHVIDILLDLIPTIYDKNLKPNNIVKQA